MQQKSDYVRFHEEPLTLRDELAVDRTVLANERTMLAYVRTALGFLILGLTFLHFLKEPGYRAVGYALMVVALLVMTVGVARFLQMRQELLRVRRMAAEKNGGAHASPE